MIAVPVDGDKKRNIGDAEFRPKLCESLLQPVLHSCVGKLDLGGCVIGLA